MLELIFVRHGETDSNKRRTFCGWTDAGLNEEGIRQAEAAARKLSSIVPAAIYSSPLSRASQTAEIVNRNYGLEITYSDSLKERNFGVWEDLTYAEVCSRYPEEIGIWNKDWISYCIDGGESAFQVFDRVNDFIKSILDRHKSGTVIIVTHLGCIQAALAGFMGLSGEGVWRFRVDNAGITKVLINDEGYAYLTGLNI